jgi:pimeloyl-ACP methyl ester carboxylesterase
LCHGMLSNRSEFFLPALSAALLQRCPRQVQHVYRFDFGGMGESEGVFEYGGYDRLTSEMLAAVSALRSKGLEVTHLLGHSMSGSGVLLFASRYSLIPHVVSIAPRYDMLSDFRFGKEDLLALVRDGVMYLRARGRAHPVPVSIDTYRERLRLDMSCVRHIGRLPREGEGEAGSNGSSSKPMHTLLLHGTEDEVIPLSDAFHLHQWMVAEKALDGPGFDGMAQAARDCTCAVVGPAVSALESLEAEAETQHGAEPKLAPAMSASMAHTLVPVPGANHCFNKPANAADLLCQTVCAWVNLHDCEQLCARAAAEPLPVDQYALRLRATASAPSASADSGAKL